MIMLQQLNCFHHFTPKDISFLIFLAAHNTKPNTKFKSTNRHDFKMIYKIRH